MIRSTLLFLGAAAVASAAALSSPARETETIGIGDTVDPKIALKDVQGRTWTLGDYRKTDEKEGQVVVLDFWSIHCPISVRYEERMKAFAASCKEKGVVFLAIDANHNELASEGEDPYAEIKAYMKKAEVTFPVLADHGNRVADLFDAKTTPHLFVIDAEGVLRYQGALDDDSGMKKEAAGETVRTWAADAVAAVLAGKEPPQTTTPPVGCTIKRVKKAAE